MNEEQLLTRFDSRNSFYGKATLLHDGDLTKLRSYNTIVATYNHKTNEIKVFGWYSSTTARHINEFLHFYGFDAMSKKEMDSHQEVQ